MSNQPSSVKALREELNKLLEEKAHLLKFAVNAGEMQPGFAERIEFTEERIRENLGLYDASLLESLNSESRKLTKLTNALIALTIILALLALPSFIQLLRTFF